MGHHVPVDGDAGDGQRRDERDADGDHSRKLAHPLHPWTEPTLVHDLHKRDRTDHGAEEQIADGQVHD